MNGKVEQYKIHYMILIFCLTGWLSTTAQSVLSLEEALRISLEKNLDITIVRTQSQISENNMNIGKAGFLPKLDITAVRGRSISDTKEQLASGDMTEEKGVVSDEVSASGGLSWTVFDGWSMFISYKKLRESRDIGRLNLRAEIDNTIARTTDAYYEIVKQNHLLRVFSEAVAISEERLHLAENNLKLGSGSLFDVLRARVDLNADQSTRLKQETLVENSKIELNRLIGIGNNSDYSVSDSVEMKPRMAYEVLKEAMLRQNSDLLIARKNSSLARLNINDIRSRWYPRLGLYGNYSYDQIKYQKGTYRLNKYQGPTFGAKLSFNLFNGFSDRVDLQNAKLNFRASEMELENLERVLDAELLKVYNNYVQASDLLSIETDNLSIAVQTLNIARERFKLGSYTPLELREAQNAYISAENRLVNARYTVKQSENEIMRMTGGYMLEEKK